MASKGVRRLRSVVMRGSRNIPNSVIENTLLAISTFSDLSPKNVSSLLTSVSVLREKSPLVLREHLFTAVCRNATQATFRSLSGVDLARTALSIGFLAKELGSSGSHLRVSTDLLVLANERMPAIADRKAIHRLIRGFAMMRLPVSGALFDFFKSINTSVLGFEEAVFALKAGIDYGFHDKPLLSRLLMAEPVTCTPTAARSLLYCAAMVGVPDVDGAVLNRLLSQCSVSQEDSKSLIPLWACTAMGFDVLNKVGTWGIVQRGLSSSSARDREMASVIAKVPIPNREQLHQSAKHERLRSDLERKYGTLVYEYEVIPGLVVDCANVEARLAIELDGPSHYLIDLSSGEQVFNGPT